MILEIAHIYIEAPAEPFPSSKDFIPLVIKIKLNLPASIVNCNTKWFYATYCMHL